MNEFIKTIAEAKCEHPELEKELDVILDMVQKFVDNEIFEGNIMLMKLLREKQWHH